MIKEKEINIKAIKILLKNTRIMRDYKRIKMHSEDMTRAEFCRKSGISYYNSTAFLNKYNLKCKDDRGNTLRKTHYDKRKSYANKWDKNKTISENALLLGISYSRAFKVLKEFNLSSNIIGRKEKTLKMIDRIKELRSKGLKDVDIARILVVSREYVRQLMK